MLVNDLTLTREAYFRLLPWPMAEIFRPNFEEAVLIPKLTYLGTQMEAGAGPSDYWYGQLFNNQLNQALFYPLQLIAEDNRIRDQFEVAFNEYQWSTTTVPPGWISIVQTMMLKKPRSKTPVNRVTDLTSLNTIFSTLALFWDTVDKTIFPEFTGVGAYLSGIAPTRRNQNILTRADMIRYFDSNDCIVEDPVSLEQHPTTVLIGQLAESNIDVWTRAIKRFVALNPILFTYPIVLPSAADRANVAYNATAMVNLWKAIIQGMTLLLAYVQELLILDQRTMQKYPDLPVYRANNPFPLDGVGPRNNIFSSNLSLDSTNSPFYRGMDVNDFRKSFGNLTDEELYQRFVQVGLDGYYRQNMTIPEMYAVFVQAYNSIS